ncbi:Integrase [Theobroma cacao]|nr:Integrase [Theobroma cacao]
MLVGQDSNWRNGELKSLRNKDNLLNQELVNQLSGYCQNCQRQEVKNRDNLSEEVTLRGYSSLGQLDCCRLWLSLGTTNLGFNLASEKLVKKVLAKPCKNYEMWDVITDGPFILSTLNVVTNELMPKPMSKWTEAETKKVQVNFKAINTLHCALTPTEFNKVSRYTTAKQVWEKLRIIHEGTYQVKESKIAILTKNYEMFKMEPGEDITNMFDRFTNITNKLSQLVTAIREAKDLNVITLDEICGSLLTHELELKEEEEEDRREAKEKKKNIALKANILEEELEELSCSDDEEFALVARKFKKLMGRRNQRLARIGFKKDQSASWKIKNKNDFNKKEELICYECKKPGHFKFECLLLKDETPKKNKKSKKAMVVATWSDSDTSSSEAEDEKSEERANICLIAQEDETEVSSSPYDISIDDLLIHYLDVIIVVNMVEPHLKETYSRAQLKKKQPWYMDSGCSWHMRGDKMLFAQLDKRKRGTVSFGDDSKSKIHGIGTVGKNSQTQISHVLLVKGLKHNLLSISQLCDKGFKVCFDSNKCEVIDIGTKKFSFIGKRLKNMYAIFLEDLEINDEICLVANADSDSWLWHKRLRHVSLHTMSKLIKKNLVVGLPNIKFESDKMCDACQLGKPIRTSFKSKKIVSTSKPLEMLHIDLFGPISTTSLGEKSYGFVIVDDYSRYTWVYFLTHKNDALSTFISHCRKVENEKGLAIVSIRSDHGGEFESEEFEKFFNEKGLDHNFSAPKTPQQNGVVERKNRTLKEMAQTMLCENNLPKYF